jgi:hypothetical protein
MAGCAGSSRLGQIWDQAKLSGSSSSAEEDVPNTARTEGSKTQEEAGAEQVLNYEGT